MQTIQCFTYMSWDSCGSKTFPGVQHLASELFSYFHLPVKTYRYVKRNLKSFAMVIKLRNIDLLNYQLNAAIIHRHCFNTETSRTQTDRQHQDYTISRCNEISFVLQTHSWWDLALKTANASPKISGISQCYKLMHYS
jgi:hypothetical protein